MLAFTKSVGFCWAWTAADAVPFIQQGNLLCVTRDCFPRIGASAYLKAGEWLSTHTPVGGKQAF